MNNLVSGKLNTAKPWLGTWTNGITSEGESTSVVVKCASDLSGMY